MSERYLDKNYVPFDHERWSDSRLLERLAFLEEHAQRPLSADRKRDVDHEIDCIRFENRRRDIGRQVLVALDFDLDDAPTGPIPIVDLDDD